MSPLRSIGSIHVHEFSNIYNGCMIPPFQGCFSPLLPLHHFRHPHHFKSVYNFVPTDLYTYYQQKDRSYCYMDLALSRPSLNHALESIEDCMGQRTGYLDHHHQYFYLTDSCQKGLLSRSLLRLFHLFPYLSSKQKLPPLFLLKRWSTYPYTIFEYRRHSIIIP